MEEEAKLEEQAKVDAEKKRQQQIVLAEQAAK